MIRGKIKELLSQAIQSLQAERIIPADLDVAVDVERPARAEHGDFSSNLALGLARATGMPPRVLAERIIESLSPTDWVSKVEPAGPGFINFFLSHTWLYGTIQDIAMLGETFGRSSEGAGVRVQVEYGSANPTGPLHVGNARNIAYGDVLASVLEAAGYSVDRENYLNDTGGQMERFGRSLEARYLEALGGKSELPEDGYAGPYLIDLGKELASLEGPALVGRREDIQAWGLAKMIQAQAQTLDRFGVKYDHWISERSLHDSGKIAAALERLGRSGHTYEAEGALWFRASQFGHSQDRVLVRSGPHSRPTYLAADTAYLLDKLERGFDRLIYLWGADHHGAAENVTAVARALGVEDRVEIILYQFVTFTGGPMSKRAGQIVTLDELIDEVGADAARFTFLTRSADSPMVFDFDLVKAQSQENPVYYVQYAHARICSILRHGREQGVVLGAVAAALAELLHESEYALMRKLAEYPENIQVAAKLRAPYRLTVYAQELAALFHAFYRDCRVVSDDRPLTQARLWLSEATRQVLANVLSLMGVTAPEVM
ncbi:MAG: arginine--tRNA ligase [Actinomycetota bacterium]